jgi:hypothetical protein
MSVFQLVPNPVSPRSERLTAVRDARFDEHLVRDRRRPAALDQTKHREPIRHPRLRRHARAAVVPDAGLIVGIERELVPRRRLSGQTNTKALLRDLKRFLIVQVRRIRPFRGIAGVEIRILAGDVVLIRLHASRREEPQPVSENRTADGRIDVVGEFHRVWRRQTRRLQLGRQVVVLPPPVHAGREERSAQTVAAFFRHDVDARTCERELRLHRAVVDADFLRGARVGHVVREFTRRQHVAETDAVVLETRVRRTAAVNRERRVLQIVRAADVLQAAASGLRGLDAWNQHDFVDVAASGGNRFDHFLREHALFLRALHVDHRSFAADCDRLGNVSEAQVCVHRRYERAFEHEAFALERIETGEREGHRVGARPQVFDLVLAGRIGHGHANFFNERRTGGFDSDGWQHRARRILHRAGNGCSGDRLRVSRGRNKYYDHEHNDEPLQDRHRHVLSFSYGFDRVNATKRRVQARRF